MEEKRRRFAGTVKVGERGQIVIPKEIRDLFGIKAGDSLLMLADTGRGIALLQDEDKWQEGPIPLPQGWDAIVLERVYLKGRAARITARHGAAHAEIEWLENE